MDQPKANPQDPKGERRFSQEQYDMLLRCSQKKDMTEWNQWRQHAAPTKPQMDADKSEPPRPLPICAQLLTE